MQSQRLLELDECYSVDTVFALSSCHGLVHPRGMKPIGHGGLKWVDCFQVISYLIDSKRGPVAQVDRAAVS
jgi:hypothetical protein